MPGSPEYRWSVGYHIEDAEYHASNSLNGESDGPDVGIKNAVLKQQSKGDRLQVQDQATFNKHLQTTQVISFNVHDKFFKKTVTLKNVSSETIGSVRFMNSLDPDNTVDQNGNFTTHNAILFTHEAGDDIAAVSADTSNYPNDHVFLTNGTHSPLILVSGDSRARVNSYDFVDNNPYFEDAYDNAPAKGYAYDDDTAIGIAFDVGSLTPGQSKTFIYYTTVDNRGGTTAINMIRCGKPTCAPGTIFPGTDL